jgi:hypothetical protein
LVKAGSGGDSEPGGSVVVTPTAAIWRKPGVQGDQVNRRVGWQAVVGRSLSAELAIKDAALRTFHPKNEN